MFEYFPDNYVWSLGVMMALGSGGQISEIDEACRPLKSLAASGDAGTEAWQENWNKLATKVRGYAEQDEKRGAKFTASAKFFRASVYFLVAERMQRHSDPRRKATYLNMLSAFKKGVALSGEAVEFCGVPYEGTELPALFIGAKTKNAPCMIVFDGFDAMKEFMYTMGLPAELKRRGVSCLVVDHPGVGEAVRLKGLKGFPEYERPAAACVDYLIRRSDVDPGRIGIMGPSAGGFFSMRAAAFEPRLACCVAWTGVWDYGALFRKRLDGSLAQSVNFFADHAKWVFGADSVEEVVKITSKMTLEGIADRIRCPVLITHGENDRQTPVADAQKVLAAISSQRRDLKIFSREEGGCEHCQADNVGLGAAYIADWVAEVLKAG